MADELLHDQGLVFLLPVHVTVWNKSYRIRSES